MRKKVTFRKLRQVDHVAFEADMQEALADAPYSTMPRRQDDATADALVEKCDPESDSE